MRSDFEPRTRKGKGNPVLVLLLAALTSAIAFMNWMELDNLLQSSLVRSAINPFSWTMLEDVFLFLVGIAWLCIVFYSHHYYSVGARKGRMWRRFFRITGIQVLIMFVCEVLLILENGNLGSVGTDVLAVVGGALGTFLVMLSRKQTSVDGTTYPRHHNSM